MPLNLPKKSNVDFLDRISFHTPSGTMFRHDRESGPARRKIKTDITDDFEAVFDMDNAETGWIAFTDKPDFVMGPANAPVFPPRPSDEHREGFRIQVYNEDLDLREFSATSTIVIDSFFDLYAAFEEGRAKKQNKDKLPRVKLAGTTIVQRRGQDYFQPEFMIVGWEPRPDRMRRVTGDNVTPIKQRNQKPADAVADLDDEIPF